MEVMDELTAAAYRAYMARHPEVNFLQSFEWGKLHSQIGDTVCRGGIRQRGKLVAAWTAIVKNARRGRYLEVPGGPVLDWTDTALVARVLKELYRLGQQHKCAFVRFRPSTEETVQLRELLKRHRAVPAPMHLHAEHTNVLDITVDEATLLAGMRRQTRYEVRRVAKRGIDVEWCTPSIADIQEFYALQTETARRHGFVQSPLNFLSTLAQVFGEQLLLYHAKKENQLLNAALVIVWGEEADYYEAASTPEARREPGAYGIVWQAIREAQRRGAKRFNFWGIAYTEDPKHRYAGVTTFKRGFGGRDVVFCPAHDIIIDRSRYLLNWTVETIRRKKRGL